MSSDIKINRGLKGIYFERSGISDIDGANGKLTYRGYQISDLAKNSSFEEVCYLLIYGNLPNHEELKKFQKKLIMYRNLPNGVYKIIDLTKNGHPMDVLRSCISALPSLIKLPSKYNKTSLLEDGIKLISQIPVIVAAHERIRNNLAAIPPDKSLNHSANWLYMLNGEKPSKENEKLTDLDFILHAEHGSNASSFAARITIGTKAGLYDAFVTAISTLSGPAHGGAAEDVMKMIEEIGEPENVKNYIKEKRIKKEPITGFGHRVYRKEDPRAIFLKEGLKQLSLEKNEPKWFKILENVVSEMEPYARHGLNVNVDFYSGAIYNLQKIPKDLYVPIFSIGRSPGWVAQCIEQFETNILIRPLTEYNGPKNRKFINISNR
tara:strand:+ start:2560 stop:3693 length:1134 start_codon:yes stop_codon:yes gene_type:complete